MGRVRIIAAAVFLGVALGLFGALLLAGYGGLLVLCHGEQECMGWETLIYFPTLAIFLVVSIGLGLVASHKACRRRLGLTHPAEDTLE